MDGLRAGEWIEKARAGWRWWLRELAYFVPGPLREVFAPDRDAILIAAKRDEFVVTRRAGVFETVIARIPRDEFAARTLRLSVPRATGLARWFADPVILELPAQDALVRSLRLPRGAARNLGAILRHEVPRQSPLDAQDIYYDYRVTAADRDGLDVALRIIRREPVDACVALCGEAGIALSAVAFVGDAEPARGGVFPVDAAAARRFSLAPRVVPALAGLVLLLTAGLVGSLYLRGEAVAADLAARVDAARHGAMEVSALQRKLDAANRQAAFLAQQKRSPAAVAVLATVSRLLPDDTSLYEFEMNGGEIRLHGFSAEAASLIALFDASPHFSDAQFRSPLMQGPTPNAQRFDLSVKLRGDAT
jgi:general secretion pathway protein L